MNEGQNDTTPRGRGRITPESVGQDRTRRPEDERGMGRFTGIIGGSFATVFVLLFAGIVTIVVAFSIWGN